MVLELTPVNQYVGTLPPGWLEPPIETPSPFGSVADGSDTTWSTLGSAPSAVASAQGALLSVDFKTPSAVASGYMHMRMRARNTAWHLANPRSRVDSFIQYLDQTGTILDRWESGYRENADNDYQLAPLFGGYVDSPRWFDFWDLGGQHDISATPDDTWNRLDAGNPLLDALNGDGLRVATWAANFDPLAPWQDYFDIFELRMVIAPDPSGPFPLRRYPPVNNGGHGPTRHWPRTVNRRAGGSY